MRQEERLINGEVLRLEREAQGWVLNDMALRACLSVKQIRQLEEGGSSAFYSPSVKVTAAKKVGSLLGLSVDQIFVSSIASVTEQDNSVLHASAADADVDTSRTSDAPTIEHVEVSASPSSSASKMPEPPSNQKTQPNTSLWAIAGLFVAALAVAAYMQPKEEAPAEPAPPLQVIPSDAEAPASAPDVVASSSSAASVPVVAAVASSPVASAAAVRPVSAASGVQPAAPAASKAP
jgi:cytoskeleton protein RodZ